MSENTRFYTQKTRQTRAARKSDPRLSSQLEELLATVKRCEAIWSLEDRIERGLGGAR